MIDADRTDRKPRGTRRGFDSLEQEVFLNLWRTYDRLRALEEDLFARFELTPQQYNILRVLNRARPAGCQTLELAGQLVSRAPDITRMIDKLEDRGLVARDRSEDDRRVVSIAITAAGKKLLSEVRGPLAKCHSRQLGHLTRKELEQLVDLLRSVRGPHETESSSWR